MDMCHMSTDLMGASGVQGDFCQTKTVLLLQHPIFRDDFPIACFGMVGNGNRIHLSSGKRVGCRFASAVLQSKHRDRSFGYGFPESGGSVPVRSQPLSQLVPSPLCCGLSDCRWQGQSSAPVRGGSRLSAVSRRVSCPLSSGQRVRHHCAPAFQWAYTTLKDGHPHSRRKAILHCHARTFSLLLGQQAVGSHPAEKLQFHRRFAGEFLRCSVSG